MKKIINCAAVSALSVLAAQSVAARDLVIAGWGGVYQDVQREAYFAPFAAEKGIKIDETTYLGGLAELKAMGDSGNVTWDLVIVEGADLKLGCDEGLFEEIDWENVAHADKLLESAKSTCGLGNVVIPMGIGYNSQTLTTAPTGMADFFDLEKFPGKRGLRTGPKFNLEFALLGDGVTPEELYSVLSTPEGLDRAFAKLDSIKPQVQFWDSGAQPVEWLVANNVAMTITYNGRIYAAKDEGKSLEFVWQNPVYSIDAWAIPAGSPHKDMAVEFLSYVNDPGRQAAFSAKMAYGPANIDASALLDPARTAILPAGANMDTAVHHNDDFWINNGDAITERWNNWVSK